MPSSQSNGLRSRLKTETSDSHNLLESKFSLLKKEWDIESYKNILKKFYDFNKVLEHKISSYPNLFKFFQSRFKTPLLELDLMALGVTVSSAYNEEVSHFFENEISDEASLWGVLYVIEGSTLGAQVIRKHFLDNYDFISDENIHFYTGYGAKTMPMWQKFVIELDAHNTEPQHIESAIKAGKATFEFMSKYLVS